MKLTLALAFQALVSLAVATTLPVIEPAVKADWDTIVVGGGPSGLAAASALGRVRRNVLLIDSGESETTQRDAFTMFWALTVL